MQGGEPADATISRIDGDQLQPLPGADVREMLRVRAFSQSEVVEYARQPIARLGLLDGLLDLTTDRNAEGEALRELYDNARQICDGFRQLSEADEQLELKPQVESRIAQLSQLFDENVVQTYEAWQSERVFLERVEALASVDLGEAPAQVRVDDDLKLPGLPEATINGQLLEDALRPLEELHSRTVEARRTVSEAVELATRQIGELKDEWSGRFEAYDSALQRRLAEANVDEGTGLPSLRAQLTRLQQRHAELVEISRQRREELVRAHENALARRQTLLTALAEARTRIREERRRKGRELTILMGGSVSIRVEKFREHAEYREQLLEMKRGSRLPDHFIELISEKRHPISDGQRTLGWRYRQAVRVRSRRT